MAMRPTITGWLEDPAIVEIMLNPDGRLWIDRLTGGLSDTGKRLSGQDGVRIVRVVAHHVGAEVHPGSPRLSAELPETGERFEGLIPPIVAAPAFAMRKPAVAIFSLADYARAGIMTAKQAEFLCNAVSQRRNILIAGGTSTGKTTLVNALLAEVARAADRVVLIEDTRKLQCNAPNLVARRTKDGVVGHMAAVWAAKRDPFFVEVVRRHVRVRRISVLEVIMFNLSKYCNKPQNLADLLPWAALVAEGIVLNKDGSFQRTAHFRGPGLESATPAEPVGVTARLNNALRRLGSGWAIFVEASRFPARGYLASTFLDPVSTLVDAERAAQFEEEGAQFESAYYLTFVFLPPPEEAARAEAFLYEGRVDERGIAAPRTRKNMVEATEKLRWGIESPPQNGALQSMWSSLRESFCEAPKTFDDVEGLSDGAKRRGNAALNKLKKSLDHGRTDLRKIAYLAEPIHVVH
jgi:hypothetical protein